MTTYKDNPNPEVLLQIRGDLTLEGAKLLTPYYLLDIAMWNLYNSDNFLGKLCDCGDVKHPHYLLPNGDVIGAPLVRVLSNYNTTPVYKVLNENMRGTSGFSSTYHLGVNSADPELADLGLGLCAFRDLPSARRITSFGGRIFKAYGVDEIIYPRARINTITPDEVKTRDFDPDYVTWPPGTIMFRHLVLFEEV